MSDRHQLFRVAVRKFGPFESTMDKLWKKFCAETGCTLQAEMIAMDLHPLHEAILDKKGLKNGDWDIAHINTDWLYEAYVSGALENMAPAINSNPPLDFPSGWSNSLLTMQQFGSDIVGLPFHDGPECLIYRKDLFDNIEEQKKYQALFGRSLQPPQTWEEFWQVARFFHRPEVKMYGSIFAGFPDGHNTVFDFSLQVWTRNGSLLDTNGEVDIDTEVAYEALNFYRKIRNDHIAIHPDSPSFESVRAGIAFANGEAAMMVNWFGFASMCEVIEASRVKGKVDITTVPKGQGGSSASLNVYWLYCIGSGSPHKEVAYDFIRFALCPENDKLLTLEGGIGCRISTWRDPEVNQVVPYYHKLESLHTHAKSLPVRSDWAQIAKIIDETVLEAVNTSRPIRELLKEGQQRIRTQQEKAYGT